MLLSTRYLPTTASPNRMLDNRSYALGEDRAGNVRATLLDVPTDEDGDNEHRRVKHHSVQVTVLGAAMLIATSLIAAPAIASSPRADANAKSSAFTALPQSLSPSTDTDIGAYRSASMSVEVVLAPSHDAQLQSLLKASTPRRARTTSIG